ncbi:unnamed protein product [Ectocarpus sp. 12 AP-2014]
MTLCMMKFALAATASGKGKPATVSGKGKPATASGKGKPATASGKGKPATASGKGKPVTASDTLDPHGSSQEARPRLSNAGWHLGLSSILCSRRAGVWNEDLFTHDKQAGCAA